MCLLVCILAMSFILPLISFKGTHLNETLSRTKIRSKNKANLTGYPLQMVLESLLTILKKCKRKCIINLESVKKMANFGIPTSKENYI